MSTNSVSNEPNPSSRKKNSSGALPFNCIWDDNAKASDNEVKNVSPPDKVSTLLHDP